MRRIVPNGKAIAFVLSLDAIAFGVSMYAIAFIFSKTEAPAPVTILMRRGYIRELIPCIDWQSAHGTAVQRN